VVESVDSLGVPEPELDQRYVGIAPSIARGRRECRREPQFDGLRSIDDGRGVYVVQEPRTSRHINTLWGTEFFDRLCKGFLLILEGLLLVDTTCGYITVV
jgi:hypothetical protein